MTQSTATAPITIRASKETIENIDALAQIMDRSRNYIVNQALQDYLANHDWQIARVRDGIAAADAGRVIDAGTVFAGIAGKHNWKR